MSARDLLGTLRARGIEVAVRAGRLLLRDPRGELSPELRAGVARHHAELLEILSSARSHPCASCRRFAFSAPTICYWCRRRGIAAVPKIRPETLDAGDAAAARPKTRACPSCGGGLYYDDPDGAECWSCRRLRGVLGGAP